MIKILALGASSSKKSINKRLAEYAASSIENSDVTVIDLNDFEMPIYSIDREHEEGIPEKATRFRQLIYDADGIIISFAEHNGSYTAAFKNIMDWASRIRPGLWEDKPMLLLSTSPGSRGGSTVLDTAVHKFPFMNGQVISSFALPFFNKNFDEDKGIKDEELQQQFHESLHAFKEEIRVEV